MTAEPRLSDRLRRLSPNWNDMRPFYEERDELAHLAECLEAERANVSRVNTGEKA